jgi:mono/diheme cytochrome c family protein
MIKPLVFLTSATLFVLTFGFANGTQAQEPASAPSAAAKGQGKVNPETLAKAKKLFEVDCAVCHNANGDGKSDLAKDMDLKLEDWTDSKSLAGKTDAELFSTIRGGKGKMPPEDSSRAKDDEVWAFIHYIRHMATGDKPAAAPAPDATPAPDAAPASEHAPAPSPTPASPTK